jgi:hypothetical protein
MVLRVQGFIRHEIERTDSQIRAGRETRYRLSAAMLLEGRRPALVPVAYRENNNHVGH